MTSDSNHSINISCPICSTKGKILLDTNIIEKNKRGITAVQVAPDLICNHSFVAYIDRNLVVRDSFVCDFKINLPEIKIKTGLEYDKNNLDLDIVRLNLLPSLLIKIITGIISGKKILILSKHDHINKHFITFFNLVLDDTFNNSTIDFISRDNYKKNKKLYKNYIILEDSRILYDKANFLKTKKSKIENVITQNFYNNYNEESSFIILKNEFLKAFTLTKDIIELNNSLTDEVELTTKRMIDFLNEKYDAKISIDYLQFLEDIAVNYFNIQLNKPSGSIDFLGLI